MLVLSHRGYRVSAAENTLPAFAAALQLGVDGFETDIRMTADGEACLFHDRVVQGRFPVESLTLAELAHRAGRPVDTLEAALQRFPDVVWNLEIKLPGAVGATVAALKRFPPKRRVLVTSFWHTVVQEACEKADVDGGVLIAHCPAANFDPAALLPGHPRARTIVWDYETSDRAVLSRAKAQGIRNFVYGAETEAELAVLARWAVDGVIVDRPELVKQTSGEHPNEQKAKGSGA